MKKKLSCILFMGLLCAGLAACSEQVPTPDDNKVVSSYASSEESSGVFDGIVASDMPADDSELDVDLLNACSGVFLENCEEDYDFHGADILVSMDGENVAYGFQFNKNQDGVQEACDRILNDFTPTFETMASIAKDKGLGLRVSFVYVDGSEIMHKDFG